MSEVVDSASKAVDTAAKESKKIAQALSIEQPLLGVDFGKNYNQYLYIQSQDNNTTIEDIIINRGNCAVIKYRQDRDMARAYRELNGDNLKTKSGQSVEMEYQIWSNDMDFYNSLDVDSKSIYKPIFPIKLAYGKKIPIISNCKTDDIIEVEIIVNGGGSIVYKPKELMLF